MINLKYVRGKADKAATKLADPKACYVYLITTGHEGQQWAKIGRAKNPKTRLSSNQVGCPLPLTLVATKKMTPGDARKLEKDLHSKYKHLHHRGEWFHWDDTMTSHF